MNSVYGLSSFGPHLVTSAPPRSADSPRRRKSGCSSRIDNRARRRDDAHGGIDKGWNQSHVTWSKVYAGADAHDVSVRGDVEGVLNPREGSLDEPSARETDPPLAETYKSQK